MTEKQLLEMKLHEFHQEKYFEVFRVIGGWIYTFKENLHVNGGPNQWAMTSVFVPEPDEPKILSPMKPNPQNKQ